LDIAFNSIPADVLVPSVLTEVDSSKATGGAQIKPWKIVLIGQRLSTGTVAALIPKALQSVDQARQWFGAGSMLHGMAMAFFANPHAFDATAIAVDDAGGSVAASLSSTLTGPATKAGSIALYIGGYRSVTAVALGDTATVVAANIVIAANAIDGCPAVASSAGAVLTITARNKGLLPTQIDVRLNYYDGEALPAGITMPGLSVIGATLSGGTTDPTLSSTLWANLGEVQYDLFICPWGGGAQVASLDAELASRWEPTRQLEASGVFAFGSDLSTMLGYGVTLNSKFLSVIGMRGLLDPPWELAAAYGANRSFYSRNDPNRPLRTLPLYGILPPIVPDRLNFADRDLMYRSGLSATVVIGNQVVLDRCVTTYQKSGSGASDRAFLDITTVDTLAYLRWSFRNRMLLRYPRHKVVKDGIRVGSGQPIVSPAVVKAEILSLFDDWMALGLVEGVDQFKRDLIVQVNSSDPTRIDAIIPPDLANPLYVIAGQIQFRL